MNWKSNLVLLALACTAALLLAAGCGTPSPLDQGQADVGDRPVGTVLPSPTVGAAEPATDEAAEAWQEATETAAPPSPVASLEPSPLVQTVTPTPVPEGEETITLPDPLTGIEDKAGAERLVALAVADLAQRLDLDEAVITVQLVEAVDWPDSSLGCPQPGVNYLQVVTPGYRVVLQARGTTYEVHTDRTQTTVLCEKAPETRGSSWEDLPDLAMEDLARRRSVDVDQIRLVGVTPDEFPADNLGCPSSKQPSRPIPAIVSGHRIELELDGQLYLYHGRPGQVVFCGTP